MIAEVKIFLMNHMTLASMHHQGARGREAEGDRDQGARRSLKGFGAMALVDLHGPTTGSGSSGKHRKFPQWGLAEPNENNFTAF